MDTETAGYLRQIVTLLVQRRHDICAAILIGSVARREERPPDDTHPSDVDLLVLFNPQPDQDDITPDQRKAISWAILDALDAYPDPPREVQVIGVLTHFARWDPMFVENVARDGLLLWARGPLPPALAHLLRLESPAPTPRPQGRMARGALVAGLRG